MWSVVFQRTPQSTDTVGNSSSGMTRMANSLVPWVLAEPSTAASLRRRQPVLRYKLSHARTSVPSSASVTLPSTISLRSILRTWFCPMACVRGDVSLG